MEEGISPLTSPLPMVGNRRSSRPRRQSHAKSGAVSFVPRKRRSTPVTTCTVRPNHGLLRPWPSAHGGGRGAGMCQITAPHCEARSRLARRPGAREPAGRMPSYDWYGADASYLGHVGRQEFHVTLHRGTPSPTIAVQGPLKTHSGCRNPRGPEGRKGAESRDGHNAL